MVMSVGTMSARWSASATAGGCAVPQSCRREAGQLRAGGGRHLLAVGVAELGAEQAREGVEVAMARGVEDVRSLAAVEHEEVLALGTEVGPLRVKWSSRWARADCWS